MTLVILWSLWAAVNLFTFVLYGVDKRRAQRDAWRIPEKTLLTATWLLGGIGACLGMKLFRHKTKHTRFIYSAPLAAVTSLVVMVVATVQLVRV